MRNHFLHLLFITALVSSMLLPLNATATGAELASEQAGSVNAAERLTPSHLEEVPADLQALFAEGVTAEEFVQMAGYVPNALADIVKGEALMIIEFDAPPLAAYYAEQKANTAQIASAAALQGYEQSLQNAQAAVVPQIESLGATIIANYTAAYNGIQVLTPLSKLNELRALPGVKAIHRAPIHERTLGASVPLIGVPDVWNDYGYDGQDTVIAVIDTGIDYTHAVFGGPGVPAAYGLNDPAVVEPNTFPTAKVVSGYDFAGTLYHAGCSAADQAAGICTVIPQPDPDPLDENGHGTHVASIAAGMASGDVSDGVAPAAKLIALKVFGRDGSTSLTMDALDWATLQYIYTGTPHVINMSLGSNFGTNDPADPSVMGTQNAAAAGIVVVASAGNASDVSYITGSPATADKAISVAASTTGYVTGPTVNVIGASVPVTQTNIVYQVASFADNTGHFVNPVTAPLGYAGALPGASNNQLCSTAGITPGALAGQVALIQRGTCAFTIKVNNAAALGAIAAIIYNNTAGTLGMTGDPVTIPAGSIQMQDGMNLVPANGQTVTVSAEDDVKTVLDPYTPADTIATFSSRGPRGYDSALKPEITAPGVGIFAANMGSGSGGVSLSGTSMAAPHIAGVAALMLQGNPSWTPEQVKAVMMNTALPQVAGATIPRTGAGRVDAYRSVDAEVVAVGDKDLVSLNYGVIMSRNDSVTRTKPVTLHNWDVVDHTFDAAVAFQTGSRTAGATLTVDPVQVMVPAGSSAVVSVTLTLNMTQIPVLYGSAGLEEYYGFVTFSPLGDGEADNLLVPFYFQPRPYSQLDTITAGDVITDPLSDIATFDLTHLGPIASDLWVYPALNWNAAPDPTMAGPGDVRLFGMDYGGTVTTYGDLISVGIDAWSYWHVPQPDFAEFDLYIDADQDGTWDYINFNWNNGARSGGANNNVWVVVQLDLSTNLLYLGSPYTIYTDYNASYMEWTLPAAWQDLGPANSAFDYQLLGFDAGGVSNNPAGSFDYVHWPLDWMLSNDLDPTNRNATLSVAVHDIGGYQVSQPLGAMIVDYNGDPRNQNGAQAYLAPIEITEAFVRVAHLAPFAEDASVTVKLDGADVLTDFNYGDSTDYIALDPGQHLVEIFPEGSATAAISATLNLTATHYYTAIAIGDGVNQDLALLALADDLSLPAAGKFHLRLGHLAPFASGDAVLADVRLQDGTPIVENVDFSDVTGFIPLDAGTYDLKITTPGGGSTLIDPLPIDLMAGQIVSAFATGDRDNQRLGVFALPARFEGFFLPLRVYSLYLPLIVKNYNPAEWLDLTILHTNDFHARVDEYNRNGARCTDADAAAGLCIAGTPRLATAVDAIRDSEPNVLLLDAGDQFQGTLFYTLFKGDVLNETMNYLGYDVMTIGNHEFDDGPTVLADFIDGAAFPIVSTNIDVTAEPALNGKLAPYVVVERDGHEVGIVGLTTPETSNISSPGPNVVFNDPVTSLQAAVDALKAQDVNKIIALTHLGYEADVALAAQVSGVDVIIGGHSHSFLYNPTDPISFSPPTFPQYSPLVPVGSYPTVLQSLTAEPVLVVTAYQWGTFLGNLDVTFDPAGLVASYSGNPIYLGADVAQDPVLDAMLDPYREEVADLIATEVGETTVDLLITEGGQQICRLGECLLGNLVADSMLAKANEMEPGANYQIAFQNGGGLRAPILTGVVTMGDVLETLPFGNAIATFELQGRYVKDALENGASRYPSANGGFAQVAGLRYVIDPAQPVGSRIVRVDVQNGTAWEALDMDAMYKVVTNDFMRKGGDNYTMFRDYAVNPYDFGPALDEALADYFRAYSPVTPVIEGRVTFAEQWLDLTLLHTNDFHARVDEYNRNGARCTDADAAAGLCIAGTPRLATAVDAIRDSEPNVLLLDAGDQFQGTLFYTLFKGDVLNETMNYLGYDVMTIGNHEFDDGPTVLADFIDGAAFPIVSTNIDVTAEPALNGKLAPYVVVERDGHEVGIVGLTTPETSNISSPGPNVVFNDPVTSLQAAVDALKAQDVNKIIALTHLGYEADVALAAQVSGVDVIIGGHSHSFLYNPTDPISFSPPTFPQYSPLVPVGSYPTVLQSLTAEPVLVVTAYQWGTFLGNLDVTFDPAGLVASYSGNPIYLGADVAQDPVLDAMLDPYREEVADLIATEVGETTVDLLITEGGQQICRLGECLLGNLVADSMLAKANEMEPGANYQIAFQNGGGLRAPILTGVVTMGDVLETLPFGNAIATFELQGRYVKDALENGASRYPSANGGFAQVAGLRYVIDPAQPVGSRIVRVDVQNGTAWEALDMDAMYKVVTNDFMRKGGDNYTMFRDYAVNPYDFGPALDEALADYFRAYSPVTPVIEGRVTFVP